MADGVSFTRYPSYKAVPIPWIDSMPDHWDWKPVLGTACERDEDNKGMKEDNLLSLSYGNIINKDINTSDGLLPESFETYQIVRAGDIVLRLTDLQNDKRSLRSALVTQKGIITSAYLALEPRSIHSKYLNYLLRAYDVSKVFYSMGGGLRQSMKYGDIKRMPLVVPTKAEQLAIAKFLDHETAKIDALIAEQQRLIELLQEKRQAVISHAVTKGLNPDVPMKDSGVEWLGEVPEHWEVKQVRHAFNVDNNLRTPIDVQTRSEIEGDFPYYGPTGVLGYIDRYVVEGSYFLIGEDGDHFIKFQRLAMSLLLSGRFNVNNHAHLLRGKGSCSTEWGYLFFESKDLSPWLIKQGVGRYKLRKEKLMEIPVAIPPLHEQMTIFATVSQTKAALSRLQTTASDGIKLLQERRSALISAAVTGQIDVRGFVPETTAS